MDTEQQELEREVLEMKRPRAVDIVDQSGEIQTVHINVLAWPDLSDAGKSINSLVRSIFTVSGKMQLAGQMLTATAYRCSAGDGDTADSDPGDSVPAETEPQKEISLPTEDEIEQVINKLLDPSTITNIIKSSEDIVRFLIEKGTDAEWGFVKQDWLTAVELAGAVLVHNTGDRLMDFLKSGVVKIVRQMFMTPAGLESSLSSSIKDTDSMISGNGESES